MHLSFFAAAALAPSLGHALVQFDWSFPNASRTTGLQDVTFAINMRNAPHKSQYFFAQEFGFLGVSQVGYIGIQPREDSGAAPIVHATFSSFVPGSTTTHSNCHQGADGGDGVSCAVNFSGHYSDTFLLFVENPSGDGRTWQGRIKSNATFGGTVIGEYVLPKKVPGLGPGYLGFMEYYPWNDGQRHVCNTLPKTEASFYTPTSNTKGAGKGILKKPYETGDCIGRVNVVTKNITDSWDTTVGF